MIDRRGLAGAFALVLAAKLAWAGPVADFETRLRAAYAPYRVALFASNSGDAAKAAAATGQFLERWEAIRTLPEPPPHYADDPAYRETLDRVEEIALSARSQIEEGRLTEAHETLEAIRAAIGDLHLRNGIQTFSDRMNAYHAQMERVLGLAKQGGDTGTLRGEAAILAYLAAQLAADRPTDATKPEFDTLRDAVISSARAFEAAVAAGAPDGIARAAGGLKPAYSKLFLRFG